MAQKVVIVDDTHSIGRFLHTALKTLDASLQVAVIPSGEEAILEASITKVDLLITDLNLPGISGSELVRKLRGRSPDTEVILMTGMSDLPLSQIADELGASAYFMKPLEITPFLDAVRTCLGMKPSGAELVKTEQAAADDSKKTTQVAADEPQEEFSETLAESLSGLRRRLGAQGVLLLDESGRSVAQTGIVPATDFETVWCPMLMAAVSSGNRVANLLSESMPASITVFQGEKLDVVLAPVGVLALVLFLNVNTRTTLRTAAVFEETIAAQRELAMILERMGIRLQYTETLEEVYPGLKEDDDLLLESDEIVEVEEELFSEKEFETLLETSTKETTGDGVDAFWESLTDESTASSSTNPDVLTFDQAMQLGLAPEDLDSEE